MAKQQTGPVADAMASRKREKQALIKEAFEHSRTAPPNHTVDCCLWCTDSANALMALDDQIEALTKQLEA